MNAPAQTAKTPQFEIRPMRAADLNEVVTLAATLEHAPTWPPAAYARALDSSLSPFRIALVAADSASGALAGFAIAAIAACEPPEAELEMIGVSAPFRRRGLALRLFASLIGELRRAGVREIYLEVRASNQPALALYYVLGFAQTGLRPRYYSLPAEDAVLMRLRIEPCPDARASLWYSGGCGFASSLRTVPSRPRTLEEQQKHDRPLGQDRRGLRAGQ